MQFTLAVMSACAVLVGQTVGQFGAFPREAVAFMAKQNKSIQKCVRMTPEVCGFVEKQDGTGFNDKFEKMVFKYEKREAELQLRLDTLNDVIQAAQERLSGMRQLIQHADRVRMYVDYIDDIINEDVPKLF